MARKTRTLTAEQRQRRRDEQRERLEQATDQLLSSEGWVRWMRVRATLGSGYSFRNTILIAQQAHERGITPTYVAGFRAWLRLNRCVRNGERGLRILAPIRRKERDEHGEETGETRTLFRETSVFDVSQTDPLPNSEPIALRPPAAETTGDSHAHLAAPLHELAGELGYTVAYGPLSGGCVGRCHRAARQIVVEDSLPANRAVMVLVHELAHALIDPTTTVDGDQEELVVESVAYIVCAGAGLDVEAEAASYLASYGGTRAADDVRRAAEQINGLVARIEAALITQQTADVEDQVQAPAI